MPRDERTLRMIREYVMLFDSGMSLVQIAEHFGLSPHTVRHYLGEIAERAGRTRKSLLSHPNNGNGSRGRPRKEIRVNPNEVIKKCDTLLNDLESMLQDIIRQTESLDDDSEKEE